MLKDNSLKPIPKKRRPIWLLILGSGISLLCIILVVRKVNWHDFIQSIQHADLTWLGVGFLVAALTYVVLAARWRALLTNESTLSLSDAFEFAMIGNLVNLILPAKMGDIGRAVVAGRLRHLSGSTLLGSVFIDRLFDLMMLLILSLAISLKVNLPAMIRTAIFSLAGTALIGLILVVALAMYENRLPKIIGRITTFIPSPLADRLTGILFRFNSGLQIIRDPRALIIALILSLTAWSLNGLVSIFFLWAFQLPVPWYAGFFIVMVANLGAMIPASPGSIGVYHFLVTLALSVWMVNTSTSLGFAVVAHGLRMLIILLLGGWSLTRQGLTFRAMASVDPPSSIIESDTNQL